MRIRKLFTKPCASIIGMVHLDALAGTPTALRSIQQITDKACAEATQYVESNLDGIIIENMNDIPYVKADQIGPEIVASMATVAREVRRLHPSLPIGVQILAGANKEALAVALAADLDFIRAEGFVFSHVADEGFIDGCAGPLLRYRKMIGADHVKVFVDIKKKHSSHAITGDISLSETANAASFFLSDGVILTGSHTGAAVDLKEFQELSENLPPSSKILIGSGVTSENVSALRGASAIIVGSHFKEGGMWQNGLDASRLKRFMDVVSRWN